MRTVLPDLAMDAIAVVYPGSKRFRLNEQIEAVPLSALTDEGVFTELTGRT